ncbi:MAG: pyruvate ferredoxin oxidoreductase [Chloroflexi bacterium]|nr:MAG: pyruvate ferredoxin oxidoreductase [Chloroflexota bacterium]HDN79887.1 pyruvate ferredoxin oxidoreductase [Chloroflexota bacterium]
MAKQIVKALDGAAAVAEAMRQIDPDVVAAYPITPQTAIVQTFSQFVADGLVGTEFIPVESEHAAMSACVGAAAAGGRVMTATAANGLALMWEVVYIAASMRLPIVMSVVNRALSAPLNIHCDHSDSMGARDSGWIQIFSENPQEAYDNTIQAIRIAEHPDVLLPVMSMQDGFITGHGVERVEVLEDQAVKDFIGEYTPKYSLLDIDNPKTFGAWAFYDYYFEFKRQQTEALSKVPKVVEEVGQEYGKLTGRYYGLFDPFEMDDAEIAIVVLSSAAGTARTVVRKLRKEGVKIGLLKPRLYRPFPGKEIVELLKDVKVVGVMDRSIAFGSIEGCGPLYLDICASFFTYGNGKAPKVVDYIFGLGGRDILPEQIEGMVRELIHIAETGEVKQVVGYLGLR